MEKEAEKEVMQAKVIMNSVELIQKNLAVAFRMNQIAGGGYVGITIILKELAESIIGALASGLSCSKEKAMEEYFNMIREHMSTVDKEKN